MMEIPSSISTFTRGPFSFHLLFLFILLCFSLHLSKVLSFQTTIVDDGKTTSFHCPTDQKSALLQLKAGFIIHRWNDYDSSKLDSWNHSADYCSWEGITCDGSTRHVIELDLSGNRDYLIWMSGRIDTSLFCLSSLQKLNLSWNYFHGHQIPSGLGHLTNLTHLDLSFSGFVGHVPHQISRLTGLHSLNLSVLDWSYEDNGFTTIYSISEDLKIVDLKALVQNLSSLEELSLNGIILAHGSKWGQALSSSLPNLRRLSLFGCDLAGPIHPSISNLHFLSELDLSGNNFSSEVPPSFGNFFSLTSLRLRRCGLHGKFPRNICLLPDLQTLDISENPLLAIDLSEFPQNNSLRNLFTSRTNLSGKLPNSFSNLKLLNSLDLSDCNLFGPFPSVIANLTQLEYLDLSYNNFDGPIPSFVDNLKHLNRLKAHSCNLSGLLPLGLGNLTKLEGLSLGSNNFNGPIPSLFSFSSLSHLEFGNVSFSKLQYVSLEDNEFHGPIPRSVFQLKELEFLHLSSNKLSGTLDLQMFQDLRNLNELDLSDNNLSISNAKWNSSFNSSQLRYLYLHSCNITEFPIVLQNQNQLGELDLSNNKISGIIPSWIWEIGNGRSLYSLNLSHNILDSLEHPLPNFPSSGLRILDLHYNMLKESPPKIHAPSLYYLDYSHNQFKSIIPSDINFTSMSYFFLSNNNVSEEIPESICEAVHLEVLDLSHNNFTGSIPKCLGKVFDSLKIFNLRGNSLQGKMTWSFSRSCNLRTLDLSKNHFEGSLSSSLANCTALEVLDIGHNMFDDTFPRWLGTLPQLRVLVLKSNKFHGPVVCHPKHTCWPRLQIMDLSFNAFTGNLSSKFFQSLKAMMGESESQSNSSSQILGYKLLYRGDFYQDSITIAVKGIELEYVRILNVFTVIDFSNNGFEGEMPKSIGDLKSLYVLNFSHNGLIGHIPTSLENLMHLESLDLSQNKLSGEIPPELVKLTFLEVLNLSKNNLTGRIPQGNQFSTFGNDSFSDNKGLCGSPLSKDCEDLPTPPDSKGAQELEEFDWRFMWIGFGFGYGIGLGMVFWTLVLWKEGSKRYIKLIDRMFVMLSPSC